MSCMGVSGIVICFYGSRVWVSWTFSGLLLAYMCPLVIVLRITLRKKINYIYNIDCIGWSFLFQAKETCHSGKNVHFIPIAFVAEGKRMLYMCLFCKKNWCALVPLLMSNVNIWVLCVRVTLLQEKTFLDLNSMSIMYVSHWIKLPLRWVVNREVMHMLTMCHLCHICTLHVTGEQVNHLCTD